MREDKDGAAEGVLGGDDARADGAAVEDADGARGGGADAEEAAVVHVAEVGVGGAAGGVLEEVVHVGGRHRAECGARGGGRGAI